MQRQLISVQEVRGGCNHSKHCHLSVDTRPVKVS